MVTLLARARGTGRIVNWAKFKAGEWVDQSRISFSHSTVIPDVIVDVMDICKSMDENCTVETVFPNSHGTASFDIAIVGQGFDINCGRRLARGFFPLNPIAAEFGSNYDVLVTIACKDETLEGSISRKIMDKYECTMA